MKDTKIRKEQLGFTTDFTFGVMKGEIDGKNKAFMLPENCDVSRSHMVFVGGQLYRPGVDTDLEVSPEERHSHEVRFFAAPDYECQRPWAVYYPVS